jgi:glycosyltransferase involved in cell wall biosynthesis
MSNWKHSCVAPNAPKTVAFVGTFRFPEGDAAAARVLGIGKALRDYGYEVVFAGGEEHGRPEDRLPDGGFAYQGFRYYSTDDLRNRPLPPLRRLVNYFTYGKNTLKWLRSEAPGNLAAVIAYHGTSAFLLRLRRWCRSERIALVADCTEWYDAAQMIGGRMGLVRWDNELRLRFVNAQIGHVIAISRYLESYYAGKGCRVVRVPPLIDLQDAKWRGNENTPESGGPLRLVYAGSPGRKDLLREVCLAVGAARSEGLPVVLSILGPTREEVVAMLASDGDCFEKLENAIVFHGRVAQSAVPGYLMKADFSVLLRPDAKYAQAGFPTKVAESLAAGVPVIANPTSDIGMYIHDGSEGVLVPDGSPEALVHGIKRILALPRDQWSNMRRCALGRAKTSFDYRSFCQMLGGFMDAGIAASLDVVG